MKKIRCCKQSVVRKVFSSAHASGLMCDWAAGSNGYSTYVQGVANKLLERVKTKPADVIEITAVLLGICIENYKEVNVEFREMDLAIDIINAMSKILRGNI